MSDLSPVSGSEIPTLMGVPGVGVVADDVLPRPHEVTTRARTATTHGALVTLRILIRLLLQKGRRPGSSSTSTRPLKPSPANQDKRLCKCNNGSVACQTRRCRGLSRPAE